MTNAQIGDALVYVLIAWSFAAAVTLCLYLAVSVADFRDLRRAALLDAVPAIWLPPAVLLLATRKPAAEWLGLLLVAAAVIGLRSRRPPQRWEQPRRTLRDPRTFAIAGAFLLEIGVCAVWLSQPLLAAVCFAAGASIWTTSALAREVYRPRKTLPKRLLPAMFVCAVLVTSWLLLRLTAVQSVHPASLWDTTRIAGRLLFHAPPLPPSATTRNAIPVFPAGGRGQSIGNGIPGVIFRPKSQPAHRPALLLPAGASSSGSAAAGSDFPFTGEYRLFRASSHSLPPASPVFTGTPLDAIYKTTDGSSIRTEAYQPLPAAIDFARFAGIELSLRTGEESLAFASLELVGAGEPGELGPEIFGLHPGATQTVEFDIPHSARSLRATAIRVAFQSCDPDQLNTTLKVAIERFTLVDR